MDRRKPSPSEDVTGEFKAVAPPAESAPPAARERPSLLDEIVAAQPAPRASAPPAALAGPTIGECVGARHPTLLGRVLVRLRMAGGVVTERWVPTLQGLAVREGDRVLLIEPAELGEPLVTGVIDGFTRRPEVPKEVGARVELKADESVRVCASNGQPLVEVFQGESGPVVRLLNNDARVELPGKLAVSASAIELTATEGSVELKANDDVVVQGETVRLN